MSIKTKKDPVSSRRKDGLAYPINPFWDKTEVKVGTKRITVGGGTHISDEGEPISHSGVHVIKEVDESEFVKIYTKNIRSIFDLKQSAQRVLEYLIVELQKTPNADAIYLAWIGAEEYFDEHNLKMSRASFYNAMKDLLNKGFLAESTKPNMFWFNPNLFFNGSRMTFVNEYRRKPSDKTITEDTAAREKLESIGQQRLID